MHILMFAYSWPCPKTRLSARFGHLLSFAASRELHFSPLQPRKMLNPSGNGLRKIDAQTHFSGKASRVRTFLYMRRFQMSMVTYKDSGVDISKNNLAKKRIGEHVRR